MITPSYAFTATERVLPRLALDWTTGLSQTGVDVARAGVATFVGSDGLIQSATADTQRIDYSTGVAGLLVEESRVNYVLQSEDFAVTWTPTRASIDANATTAPNGANDGFKLKEDASTTTTHFVNQSAVAAGRNKTLSYSVYVKSAERTQVSLMVQGATFTDRFEALFDLSSESVLSSNAAGASSISAAVIEQSLGNGWYRLRITGVVDLADTNLNVAVRVQLASGGSTSYTGDGESGLYIWGAQVEVGAFPTSYIPTEATAVTRNADVATMTGTNFSDWFNASEGTFVSVFSGTFETAQTHLFSVSDGTSSNRISVASIASSQINGRTITSGSTQHTFAFAGAVDGQRYGASYGLKLNDCAFSVDAESPSTSSSTTLPTVDRMYLGSRFDGTSGFLNGCIDKLLYYPQRLTTNEIRAFSKG